MKKNCQSFFIDSTNLQVSKHFDFKAQLNERPIVKEYVKLTRAVISFDSLLIDNSNNTFTINSLNYQFPQGNFTLTALLANMVTLAGGSFTATFSQQTYKIAITNSSVFTLKMSTDLA